MENYLFKVRISKTTLQTVDQPWLLCKTARSRSLPRRFSHVLEREKREKVGVRAVLNLFDWFLT
jgi:hypothetical protein